MKTLRKRLSTDGIFNFADFIRAQENLTSDSTEVGDIMLTIMKGAWLCGCNVPTLQDYD